MSAVVCKACGIAAFTWMAEVFACPMCGACSYLDEQGHVLGHENEDEISTVKPVNDDFGVEEGERILPRKRKWNTT